MLRAWQSRLARAQPSPGCGASVPRGRASWPLLCRHPAAARCSSSGGGGAAGLTTTAAAAATAGVANSQQVVELPSIPVLQGPWVGLEAYRQLPQDFRWTWGQKGPYADEGSAASWPSSTRTPTMPSSLAECGLEVLLTEDPKEKVVKTHAAFRAFTAGELSLGDASAPHCPARPAKPELVPVREMPGFDTSPLPLVAHMLHNLTHVELNAIDLAWDTVVRYSHLYPALPIEFYADFARVADDESRHLGWCLQRLEELGHAYGDMPAHNMLWEGAEATSSDISARLALIPCVQEARGLDAGPRLADRLRGAGDVVTADIVKRIAQEELAHVAVGVTWFSSICAELERSPESSFQQYVAELCPGGILKGPFNVPARHTAGLPQSWYDAVSMQPTPKKAKRNQRGKNGGGAAPGSPSERAQLKAAKNARNQRAMEELHGRLASVLVVESAAAAAEKDP